jgi:hypothetical protein
MLKCEKNHIITPKSVQRYNFFLNSERNALFCAARIAEKKKPFIYE